MMGKRHYDGGDKMERCHVKKTEVIDCTINYCGPSDEHSNIWIRLDNIAKKLFLF